MNHPSPNRKLHLGVKDGDLLGKPYEKFWNPKIEKLPEHALQALAQGPLASPLLLPLASAPQLFFEPEQEVEDGFGINEDGSLYVAIHTDMQDVTPAMIDWWFHWHSDEPQRYKLWHPRAHVHAEWGAELLPQATAATEDRRRYVGRVSFVDEYLGSEMAHIGIQFLPPSALGFDESVIADPEQATLVAARVHFAEHPLEVGYIAHHVIRVPGGSKMRSRFWLGGPYANVRIGSFVGELVTRVARVVRRPSLDNGRELLVHCAQEMFHLSTFLPALYSELCALP